MKPLRILAGITYYRPYVSGLTIYAERLARALVAQGHRVTVLTSRHDPTLPLRERDGGIEIVRVPVAARVSKAVLMPSYPATAARLARRHDLVHLHLPQPESTLLASIARFVARRPIVATYHCDLKLPPTRINRAINGIALGNNLATGALADVVVAYTEDYARHSQFLLRVPGKRRVIPPPVTIPRAQPEGIQTLRDQLDLGEATVIGFAARFAAEKGVEHVLDALPILQRELGDVRVLFAGPYRDVIGEEAYLARLTPRIEALGRAWTFLGVLDPQNLANFFAACNVTILPSVNSTESFGLVQVEAMLTGTPVVASNLAGVRVPVQTTGMGEIVPIGDSRALADAILRVVKNRASYIRPREQIARAFSLERTVRDYEELFHSLCPGRPGAPRRSRRAAVS